MWYYPASALIIAATSITLGLFVIFKKRSPLNKRFFYFTLVMFFWSFSYFWWQLADNAATALFWSRALMAGAIFLSINYYYFILTFLDQIEKRKKSLIFGYIAFSIFFIFNFTPLFIATVEPALSFKFWPKPGILFHPFLALFFYYYFYILYLLISEYKKSKGLKRSQIKFILFGIVLTQLGGSTNYLLWYDVSIAPITNIASGSFVWFTAYAIIRHRLMDIKLVIKKSTVFIFSLLTLISFILAAKFLNRGYLEYSDWYDLVILALAVLIYSPIQKFFSRLANKYFFSPLYDSRKLISGLSYRLRTTLEIESIYRYVFDALQKSFHMTAFAVLTFDSISKTYLIDYSRGISSAKQTRLLVDSEIDKDFVTKNKIIVTEELAEIDARKYEAFIVKMKNLGIEMLIPLKLKYETVGLIALGPKESGEIYNTEDIQVLEIISGFTATAIENAGFYKEIKEKSENLEGLLNMKSDFLRVVNHQLNTPLSIMRLAFNALKDKTLTHERAMEMADEGINRISRTLSAFWHAYQLEGEQLKMDIKKADIEEVVLNLVEEKRMMPAVKKKGLTIKIKLPDFIVPPVLCDADKVIHAISNLLDNAVHYTSKGSVIVSYDKILKKGVNYLEILISDTGVGIKPEDQKNLYKKFSRGSRSTSYYPDGSGLGLYIAKQIVEANKGSLSLKKTEPNKGTTFSLILPILSLEYLNLSPRTILNTEKTDENTIKIIPDKNKIKSKQKTRAVILMIEDEKDLAELYESYFKKYKVEFHHSGEIYDGLAKAKSIRPDVIFLDIIIPQRMVDGSVSIISEQGYDFLRQIKADPNLKDIPVIMFTNLDTADDRAKARNLGASGYIVKSVAKPEDLLRIIKDIKKNVLL